MSAEKAMNVITKIKPLKHGLKGLKVTYNKHEERAGLEFINDYDVTYRYPVQGKIINIFTKLIEHFGLIYQLKPQDGKYPNAHITAVEISGDSICLSGLIEPVMGGFASISGVFVEEANYPDFPALSKLIEKLIEETIVYVRSDIEIDAKKFVMQFHEGKMSKTELEHLAETDEEWRNEMIKALEKTGAVVLREEIEVE